MDSIVVESIGYFATFLGTITFLPQVIQMYRTKRVQDVSLLTFSINTFSAGLWLIYAFMIQAYPLVLVNAIIGTLSLLILIMKFKYQKK